MGGDATGCCPQLPLRVSAVAPQAAGMLAAVVSNCQPLSRFPEVMMVSGSVPAAMFTMSASARACEANRNACIVPANALPGNSHVPRLGVVNEAFRAPDASVTTVDDPARQDLSCTVPPED